MQDAKRVKRAQLCAQTICDSLQVLQLVCFGLRDAGFRLQCCMDDFFQVVEAIDLFCEGVECLSGLGSCLVVFEKFRDEVQRQLLIGSLQQVIQTGQLFTAECRAEAVDTAFERLREML